MNYLIAACIGFILGVFIYVILPDKGAVGILRIVTSDSEDDPYLFLEIDNKQIERLTKSEYVTLKVRVTEDYSSHK